MAILFAIVIFIWLISVFQLKKFYWQNDIIHDFYSEPEETIEVAFLGSSHVTNGIIPIELYRDYGICAYNFGTSLQPVSASYYWLQEMWNYHHDTVKTVVLETSMLRYEPQETHLWNAYAGMRNSKAKAEAIKDYFLGEYGSGDWSDVLSHLNPMTEGHSHWKELKESNFKEEKSTAYKREYRGRGRSLTGKTIGQNFWTVGVSDDEEECTELNEKSLYYYEKILDFCKEHKLKLILIATPTTQWTAGDHNAIQRLADKDDVNFLDFNLDELKKAIELSYEVNAWDYNHLNYYGASKLTHYMGEYLIQNDEVTDIRGQEKYKFMEQELSDYNADIVSKIQYANITTPEEYLNTILQDDDNTIFITVRDDASGALTEEQKVAFEKIGLMQFKFIGYPKAYIAIIDGGKVVYEKLEENMDGTDEEKQKNADKLEFEGILSDGSTYYLMSSGFYAENKSSCIINGEEQSTNHRGLNIVVYNKKTHNIVDTTYFDTWASSSRSMGDTEKELKEAIAAGKSYNELMDESKALYRYNYKDECIETQKKLHQECGTDGVLEFLDTYYKDGKTIFVSVKDEAANTFDENVREEFRKRSLEELASLELQDSYLAVIRDGNVEYEQRDHGEVPIEFKNVGYHLISGGMESGNVSSIEINGQEYSQQVRGLNIVVYDEFLNEVIDQITFDTFENPARI